MKQVYASIDIGSDSIKVVICELFKGKLNLLAATSIPSKGIKKGLIIDPKKAKEALIKAIKKAEEMLGVKIKKTLITVPPHHINYKFISGTVEVKNSIVTEEDMLNSYKNEITNNLHPDKEYITAIPTVFKIDGKAVTKDPRNYPARTLDGRALLITSPKKNVYSAVTIIESMNIEVTDICVSSLSDANVFKNERFQRGISSVINIGSDMTIVSLYNKGLPVSTKILGIGGKDIDKDLCYKYRISIQDARNIKEKFVSAYKKNNSEREYYETKNIDGVSIKISQKNASKIVISKLEEIINLAKNELEDLTNHPVQYIMVTGGVSNISDFNYILRSILPQANVGKINLIGIRNNKYSTALGNIVYYLETLKYKEKKQSMFSEDDMDRLSSPTFLDENTVLGKVFSYFFDE